MGISSAAAAARKERASGLWTNLFPTSTNYRQPLHDHCCRVPLTPQQTSTAGRRRKHADIAKMGRGKGSAEKGSRVATGH